MTLTTKPIATKQIDPEIPHPTTDAPPQESSSVPYRGHTVTATAPYHSPVKKILAISIATVAIPMIFMLCTQTSENIRDWSNRNHHLLNNPIRDGVEIINLIVNLAKILH